jgi:hypothetical protein
VARFPVVLEGYRFVRHPDWQRAVAADLRTTRATSAFLDGLPEPGPDAPVALVGLYRDDVFDLKTAFILASALRTRGARVVVLSPSGRDHRIRRYAAAFRITDVRSRDDVHLAPDEIARVERAAAALLAGPTDLESVRDWTHDGYAVGFHILSTLIRRTFDGSPDLRIDGVRGLLADITREVLTTYVLCGRVLDDVRPRVVLVEEANYAHNGPLVDVAVARGIDVVQTITTWRDDALMSKRLAVANRRVDGRSVARETLARLEANGGFPDPAELDVRLDADAARRYDGTWRLGALNQPGTRPFTREEIVAEVGLDPSKPTVVVFAHVLWDASLFYGVDLFGNYSDWLRHVVRAAAANPRVNWVIKTHPSNVFRAAHGDVAAGASSEAAIVAEELPELPPHVLVLPPDTPISTQSLYGATDVGLTVRGTPGLELACFGVPVLTAGTGSYSGLGFTVDSTSPDEYLRRLAALPEVPDGPPDRRARARRYAYTLFLRRPWAARSFRLSFDYAPRGWHPLDRNARWAVESLDALRESSDLGGWADWVLGSHDPDYVPALAPDAH